MQRQLPPLPAVRAFEAAARLGSFVRAGEELCVSPGAVGHQIRQLEEWLGVPLFSRGARSVELSAIGKRYFLEVKPLLEELERASLAVREAHGNDEVINPVTSAVISFQNFQSGAPDALSVIPHTARLDGMVKWFDKEAQAVLRSRLIATAEGIAAALGGKAIVTYSDLYPPTVNTPQEAELLARAAAKVVGKDRLITDLEPSMGSEDFAFMLLERPGAYFRLGQGMGDGKFLHHPEYDFNDATIPVGSAVFCALVQEALGAS